MSNSTAIATVTATLKKILDDGLQLPPEITSREVSAKPPSKARNGVNARNQLNLFLYHVEHNAAWHDTPMPGQGRDALPPLALTLYYLLTAYNGDDDEIQGHNLLGRGMQTFFDTPTLRPNDIRLAMGDSDLFQQVELINITRQPITVDEMSKLWTTFQTDYRISVAYQVSVVLIESRRMAQPALPILRRGSEDRGVISEPDPIPPFPEIRDDENNEPIVIIPKGNQEPPRIRRQSAQLGDIIQFKGHHLSGNTVSVRFSNPRLRTDDHHLESEDEIVPSNNVTDKLVRFTLPDNPAKYPAGVYTVTLVVQNKKIVDQAEYDDIHVTNEVAVGIAPEIIRNPPPNPPEPTIVNRDVQGKVVFTLMCKPQVRPGQRVVLFVSNREIGLDVKALAARENPANPEWTIPTDALIFQSTAIEPGEYLIRLRVDGIDSFSIITNAEGKLVFDPNQKVVVR